MHVRLNLSNQYRQEQLIATGKALPQTVNKELPLAHLSPDSRRILVLLNPSLVDDMSLTLPKIPSTGYDKQEEWYAPFEPQTPEEWGQLLTAFGQARSEREEQNKLIRLQKLHNYIAKMEHDLQATLAVLYQETSVDPVYEQFGELYQKAQTLLAQIQERYAAAEAENKRVVQAEAKVKDADKQRLAREKAEWIRAHGSKALRERFDAGYDCQRAYVVERAMHEYPSYTVDFNNEAEWKTRSCPGDVAFAEAQRVGGTVVFLTKQASDTIPQNDYEHEYGAEPFEPSEAVVISGYLGKYTLVRQMD